MNGANLDCANAGSLTFNGIDEFVQLPQTTLFQHHLQFPLGLTLKTLQQKKLVGEGEFLL